METYEYIRISLDMGDLGQLNRLSSAGWRVVAVIDDEVARYALLERPLPKPQRL